MPNGAIIMAPWPTLALDQSAERPGWRSPIDGPGVPVDQGKEVRLEIVRTSRGLTSGAGWISGHGLGFRRASRRMAS